jgi:NitT/TauT family transport system ATP-binding protein
MVFQSFALFPWLTVQQNVELGLEAQGMAAGRARAAPKSVLELIGLAGFGKARCRANSRAACASASASRARW